MVMANYGEKHINKMIGFDFYKSSFFALCVGIDDEGKLVCYRARQKNVPKFSREILVEDSAGNNLGFVVEYACKFRIHPGCVRKDIFECESKFIMKINQMYCSLPPLKELIDEYKELKTQYYHTPAKESKGIRHKMGELSYEIDARQAVFLEAAKVKKTKADKYRNFREVPNRNGISRIYKGGGCSGK